MADTEQLTTENGQESSVLACPSVNGKLHVEGSKLVDQNNNEVQLRGVSTHGLASVSYTHLDVYTRQA